jgi:hypothetical protein
MSTASDFKRDLEMAKNPNRWPVWPQLPLKRIRDGNLECGRLIERGGIFTPPRIEPVVYFGTIFEPTKDAEKITYQDLSAIFDDGWRVD